MKLEALENKNIILFDGVCNLCNTTVIRVIKYDNKNVFFFTPLQSDVGKTITDHFNINTKNVDSILLHTPKDGVLKRSTAVLKIASNLKFPISMAFIFLIIPEAIRDYIYNFVAKNRYHWFGKKNACMIPNSEIVSKFL